MAVQQRAHHLAADGRRAPAQAEGGLDGGRDTSLLLADIAAVLLVYTPLAFLVLGRRRAAQPAWPAA